jgi:hypothetical protein
MSGVFVKKLAVQAQGTDTDGARRMARRVAEMLGQGLAGGPAVRPRREAIMDIQIPEGLGGDRLAEYVAREIRRQLG